MLQVFTEGAFLALIGVGLLWTVWQICTLDDPNDRRRR